MFNGNIAATAWNTASENNSGNPVSSAYGYSYDALNRITGAIDDTEQLQCEWYWTYDKNGNILKLNRHGYQESSTFTGMDVLDYDYDSGNKLLKVADSGNGDYGFKDGNNTSDDFEYDLNGNMEIDRNKGITNIIYNHLNLPEQVSFGSQNIKYVYDATGTKLKKTSSSGTETLYANGYIYEGGIGISELQFFNHPEGYIAPDGQGGYDYVYNYVDHLGSVRLSYTDADGNGSIDPANEIIEDNTYYPFGLEHKGYNNVVNGREHNYKYNGKEHQQELGLNWYDYQARNYDPALGRWHVIDPLADEFYDWSPYTYAFNDPIRFVDPDGMAPDDIVLRGKNNSSVTIKTDLINVDVNVGGIVGDLGGNYSFER